MRVRAQAEIGGCAPHVPHVSALRAAAVLITIGADPPHRVLFVERAAHLRDHPGQIGFPGGGVDPADGDDRTRTALRELEEELGISPERVTVVGRLAEVRLRANSFVVTPFVGVLAHETPLTIDPAETAAVFHVPLATIVARGAVRPGVEQVGADAIDTWMFDVDGRHVWGLTARILRDLVFAWNLPQSALRAAIEAALGSPLTAPAEPRVRSS